MHTKYNLLYVIHNSQFGGGERGFSQLVERLDSAVFNIHVATTARGRFYNEVIKSGAVVFPVNFSRLNLGLTLLHLVNIIKQYHIDIVHSQGARADFVTRLAGLLSGRVKTVSTVQMAVDGYDVSPFVKSTYQFLDRFSERFVDRFIVVSDRLLRTLVENHNIDAKKVSKIYNGIETSLSYGKAGNAAKLNENIIRSIGLQKGDLVIGAFGRLVWQKGFEFLIKAMPGLLLQEPKAKLMIVGEGPLLNKFIRLAASLKISENVIFTGFREDVNNLLLIVDVVAIPSLREGFPMITLEAMAASKAIVATKIDGILEQIDNGVDGLLVPPRNASMLTNAIAEVIGDKDYACKLGLAARTRLVQQFTVEMMMQNTRDLYLSLWQDAV